MLRHCKPNKECRKSQYIFCTTDKGYLCYLDGKNFGSRLSLLEHMTLEHRNDKEKLHAFGLDFECLREQAFFLNNK